MMLRKQIWLMGVIVLWPSFSASASAQYYSRAWCDYAGRRSGDYDYIFMAFVRPINQTTLKRKWDWFGKVRASRTLEDARIMMGCERLAIPTSKNEADLSWRVHRHVTIVFSSDQALRIPPPEMPGWQGSHTVFTPHAEGGWRAKRAGAKIWDHVQGVEIKQEDIGPPDMTPVPDVLVRGRRISDGER